MGDGGIGLKRPGEVQGPHRNSCDAERQTEREKEAKRLLGAKGEELRERSGGGVGWECGSRCGARLDHASPNLGWEEFATGITRGS